MKKIFIFPFVILMIFTACSAPNQPVKQENVAVDTDYVKSVWITYYEMRQLISDRDEKAFRKKIDSVVKELKSLGFSTLTVQVRPCADALYKSEYYPSSYYAFGSKGDDMPYDPFAIICDCCKKYDLNTEAWINPYRVSLDVKKDPVELYDFNFKLKSSDMHSIKDKLYFDPSSDRVVSLITKGVEELVRNYNVSAIHFDDYFYPTTDKKFDLQNYNNYKKKKGTLSLADWRRQNVNKMLLSVSKAIKKINPAVRFGVSPSADIEEDYSKLYADVELWSKDNTYIDYICPQIYFGFHNENMPFMFTVKKWMEIVDIDMYVGLPLYKVGKTDKYAGDNGKNEFVNDDVIAEQIKYLAKIDKIKGVYVFSYSSIKGNEDSLKQLKEM